jgi:hypothetical protein
MRQSRHPGFLRGGEVQDLPCSVNLTRVIIEPFFNLLKVME